MNGPKTSCALWPSKNQISSKSVGVSIYCVDLSWNDPCYTHHSPHFWFAARQEWLWLAKHLMSCVHAQAAALCLTCCGNNCHTTLGCKIMDPSQIATSFHFNKAICAYPHGKKQPSGPVEIHLFQPAECFVSLRHWETLFRVGCVQNKCGRQTASPA